MDEQCINSQNIEQINYGKKCPKCYEINDKDAHWCMECGKAILSVEVRRCDSFHESDLSISKSLPLDSLLSSHPSDAASTMGIRRCESFHGVHDNVTISLPFQRSTSQPMDNFAGKLFEDNNVQMVTNSFSNLHMNQIGVQDDGIKSNLHMSASAFPSGYNFHSNVGKFDEHWNLGDRNTDRNTAIYKRTVQDEKTHELPYFYAFDDLLYPNYAMDDPVMGFVLPSSNIVSNIRTPFFVQTYQTNDDLSSDVKYDKKKFTRSLKKHGRWKKKKNKLATVSIRSKEKPSSQLDLPEEIILYIFSFLNISNLGICARVSKQFHRISLDETLWHTVVLRRKHTINDKILGKIARKYLRSLTITQCNAKSITTEGVVDLLEICSQSLKLLNVSGSSGGLFASDAFILLVSERCENLHSLDISWSNVGNKGVEAICHASKRFIQLSLNGCQAVTDEAIKLIAEKHFESLKVLELFGCFNVSPTSINLIATSCKQISTLNLGQCHKVTNSTLCLLAKGLPKLESLDIRGCKQVRDSSLREIIINCQWLSTLIIANCPFITDSTLITLASVCPLLRCLDVCGIGKISDRGVETLSRSCSRLESLDLSSTKATGRSVMAIANNCRSELESLKLSFCHSITDSCLNVLVMNCKKLKSLHLYGCRSLHNLTKLMERNPRLKIEKESLR